MAMGYRSFFFVIFFCRIFGLLGGGNKLSIVRIQVIDNRLSIDHAWLLDLRQSQTCLRREEIDGSGTISVLLYETAVVLCARC